MADLSQIERDLRTYVPRFPDGCEMVMTRYGPTWHLCDFAFTDEQRARVKEAMERHSARLRFRYG